MLPEGLAVWVLGAAVVALALLALGLISTVLWVSAAAARAEDTDRRWRENGR